MQDLSARTRVIALRRAADGVLEHPSRRGTVFARGDSAFPHDPFEERLRVLRRDQTPTWRLGIIVRRDHGRAGDTRFRSGRTRTCAGGARRQPAHPVRTLDPGRPVDRLGALGAPAGAPGGALPRRQLTARADGALRRHPHQPGPPPPDELVPLSRARFTPIPALPEPPVHDLGRHRPSRGPRHRLPLVPVPAARIVATRRLLEWPAVRTQSLDRRRGRSGRTFPGLGRRHRLRDEGVRLGWLRRVDPTVGVVDAPAGVGLHVPGAVLPAGRAARRPLHHGDGRAALRDGVSGFRAARGVAVHRAFRPVASTRPRRGARRCRAPGVGLGHRPVGPAVPLGGAQPGARRHGTRERLRRQPDAVVAPDRPPVRRRALAGRHAARGRRHWRLHRALAFLHGGPRPSDHLGRSRSS